MTLRRGDDIFGGADPNDEMTDESFMHEALLLAEQGMARGEVPVGAIVVHEGGIIGRGFNRPITSSDPCAHAEIVALREAAANLGNYRLVGASVYVTLEPCLMCAGALVHARIARLVFGVSEPKSGAIRSQARALEQPYLNHRVEVVEGVLERECREIVQGFFRNKRSPKASV